ncbi:MAG TPA: hypothetical protein VNV36_05400 [Pseudomonas sp.]|nr:hypothetical protein [Pseudomonas sp.]HWH86198.1 hypothetical protein [Pseudomonas sp.]
MIWLLLFLKIIAGWFVLACIVAAIFCRLIHLAKVFDEQVASGINWSMRA